MKKQIACRFGKFTKGAVQYKQVDQTGEPIKRDREGLVVGNIYLRKAAIRGKPPVKITVTIEY
jgi:hypothetical protein